MGNQQLDNRMKEHAVECEDFKRSYESEIQHLEAEWNTPATTREDFQRENPGAKGKELKSARVRIMRKQLKRWRRPIRD